MTNLSQNIEKRLKSMNMSQRQLALAAGLKAATVSNLISGRIQRTSYIVEIAEVLGCTAEDLMHAKTCKSAHFAKTHRNTFQVPYLDSTLEKVDDVIYTCPTACSDQTFAFKVNEIAMQPRFWKQDIVFVDSNKEPFDGCFVVAQIEDGGAVRRLTYDRNSAYLEPLNPLFLSQTIKVDIEKAVKGVIICSVSHHI